MDCTRLTLRAERSDDATFLFHLFASNAASELRVAAISEAMRDSLISLQHRAQLASYRAAFPYGRFQVAELNGAPIGRLVENDEPDLIHVIDIALLPERQRQGIGRRLIAGVVERAGRLGLGVRARVHVGNIGSERLFGALGFTKAFVPGAAQSDMIWRTA
jgi:RimJ/RimL family protein N-acetyltransferase